jgi:hypothetical protein
LEDEDHGDRFLLSLSFAALCRSVFALLSCTEGELQ